MATNSELDVQQAKAQYLGTLSTIPQLEGSLRQNQNALGVLLARPPGPLPEIAKGKDTIPQAELGVIVDLPADLLRRRPDVRAVEMQLAAQSAQIGVAEADFYPSITLLGSLGLSATSLAGSPRTLAYGIGPSLVWNVFDHGRLTGEVLVQDARFQQLYEQYQAAVLKAAREVDDAAVGFATNRAQIPILKDAVNAAQRSLAIANIQYQEGISDFQRVLDTQRTLFSQQELLVTTMSNVTLSLIALYKAMGGGWQQGRGRPLVDDATRATMGERSDWREILAAPLPPPDAGPQLITPTSKAMSEEPAQSRTTAAVGVDPVTPKPGKGTRIGAIILLVLIVGSLLWYFAADRLTPHSSQARVQAFVVPVAAEVAGKVLAVHVKNNDDVERGQPLFEIDPSQYQIALQRSRADYESVRHSVNASVATVEAARASLQAAQANRVKADKDATRQEALYAEDRGAISVRRLEIAQATRIEARSKEQAAEADLRKAQEAAGDAGDDNAQLRSARSAIEKAELDLARTKVVAPARGLVTDLRTDVGHFAQAGAPAMTLIAIHDLWIDADMTENNLGNIDPGDEVAIVLDVLPGEVLKGRVRSVG